MNANATNEYEFVISNPYAVLLRGISCTSYELLITGYFFFIRSHSYQFVYWYHIFAA